MKTINMRFFFFKSNHKNRDSKYGVGKVSRKATSLARTTPKSFASKVVELSDHEGKWSLAKARNNKKIVPVKGIAVKGPDDDLEGVAPFVKDFWDISVSHLVETTTADKVKSPAEKRHRSKGCIYHVNKDSRHQSCQSPSRTRTQRSGQGFRDLA